MSRRIGMFAVRVCLSLAVTTAALVVLASAAQANPQGTTMRATAVGAQRSVSAWTTTSTSSASRSATTADPCETVWTEKIGRDLIGIELLWFKTKTYWCWNWLKVTSHTTSSYGAVTGTGAAGGWEYIGLREQSFHCYKIAGYASRCGGNYEDAEGYFQECLIRIGCASASYPYKQLWENGVTGEWFHN